MCRRIAHLGVRRLADLGLGAYGASDAGLGTALMARFGRPNIKSCPNFSPGASQYAPGREQKTPGGSSELSPGDRMNDTRGQGGR
jgi:hypothetical protein